MPILINAKSGSDSISNTLPVDKQCDVALSPNCF